MKKIALLLMIVSTLVACGPSQEQLIAEQNYYAMLSTVAVTQKPLVDIELADPDKPANIKRIQVNLSQLDSMKQYRHIDYAAPWLNVVAAAMPYAGVYFIGKSIGDAFKSGDTYYQSGGGAMKVTGNTSFGNMGNSNTVGLFEVNNSYNPSTLTTTNTTTTSTTDTTTEVK